VTAPNSELLASRPGSRYIRPDDKPGTRTNGMKKDERRKHVRTAFDARVRLMHPSIGEIEVTMHDISDGGVFLFTGNCADLPVGEHVQIQALGIDDAPVLDAEVVRCQASGVGLMFSGD